MGFVVHWLLGAEIVKIGSGIISRPFLFAINRKLRELGLPVVDDGKYESDPQAPLNLTGPLHGILDTAG